MTTKHHTPIVAGSATIAKINDPLAELDGAIEDLRDGTLILTSPDINGGTIDGAVIGGTTPAAGTFNEIAAATLDFGPNFRAYLNAPQSVNNATITKVLFDTESWDVGACFASNKWTPNKAGKYLLVANITFQTFASAQRLVVYVYKNGAAYSETWFHGSSANTMSGQGIVVVDANGSTDYFEVYVQQTTGAPASLLNTSPGTWFAGARIA